MSSPSPRSSSRQLRLLWVVVLVLGAGLLVRLLVWRVESGPRPEVASPDAAPDEPTADPRWTELELALEEEAEARRALAREVAELRDALARAGLLDPERSPPPLDPAAGPPAGAETDVPLGDAASRPSFDADALLRAGFDPARVADLRERWEEHELEKLYLRDQATREGWVMSARHREEQLALGERLRQELGDEDYAAMLYARGRPNTVEVTDVLDRSPASDAGLEPGDAILRYDGVRVFRPNGLRVATAAGEAGEFVSLEVLRAGRPVTLRVRRGPLGVMLRGASRPPP